MTSENIIKAIEAHTGLTINGDPDTIVLALGFLSNDRIRKEVSDRVWANRK